MLIHDESILGKVLMFPMLQKNASVKHPACRLDGFSPVLIHTGMSANNFLPDIDFHAVLVGFSVPVATHSMALMHEFPVQQLAVRNSSNSFIRLKFAM